MPLDKRVDFAFAPVPAGTWIVAGDGDRVLYR
jgi:hypothetical protein